MCVCLPVLYVLYIIRSSLQGMGNTVWPMISGIGELIMRTSAALLLPAVVGETGVFLAEVLAWFGADVILISSYLVTVRKTEEKLKRQRVEIGKMIWRKSGYMGPCFFRFNIIQRSREGTGDRRFLSLATGMMMWRS